MKKKRIAVLPGSYDPVTYGHLDIIERGAALYDELVVAVSENPAKEPLLPLAERLDLIRDLTRDHGNIRAEMFTGMTIEFAKRIGAEVILRGIRTFADFEYEFQLALANKRIGDVETVFIMSSAERSFIRSSLIKEAVALGGDVSPFVPKPVFAALTRRLKAMSGRRHSRSRVGLDGDETPEIGRDGQGLRGEAIE
ncbi:MAG: pantetheine-phosphate adenylyltransferase [Planctomycetota bacterium]|jgi:pantetheine-phosphate adenylyltransferase|nr:pantetheine-phosphate adenylyltransferase [Planctomycetota bacterium]